MHGRSDLVYFDNNIFLQVELVVTLLPTNAKDGLAQFSNSKFIGSYQLQLEGERELPGYIARTFKVQFYFMFMEESSTNRQSDSDLKPGL